MDGRGANVFFHAFVLQAMKVSREVHALRTNAAFGAAESLRALIVGNVASERLKAFPSIDMDFDWLLRLMLRSVNFGIV